MHRAEVRIPLALLAAMVALPADGIAQQQEKSAVNRTIVDAPLAPGPDKVEGAGAQLGLQPSDETAPVGPNALLHVPVTEIYPGAVKPKIEIDVPDLEDNERIWRGKQYFNQFNCIGCHAPHGAGGMGPSLSNTTFLYGQEPENIYLTILQGRPLGMPAWGGMLPDQIIWDLVAYVKRMARDDEAAKPWGKTVSLDSFTIEQVPAGYVDTIEPWKHTQPFSFGQPPFAKVKTPKKEEPDDAVPQQ